jgi:hypothetical protein
VTSIGASAFQGCTILSSINIPDSVTSIGASAFADSGLRSIIIPGNVTRIENNTFANTELTSVIIPDSVANIGVSAFQNCRTLFSVTFTSNTIDFHASSFDGDLHHKFFAANGGQGTYINTNPGIHAVWNRLNEY